MLCPVMRILQWTLFTLALGILISVPISAQTQQNACPVGGVPIISCPVINDKVISNAVRVRLSGIVCGSQNCVRIDVINGVVTLSGRVHDQGKKDIAALLAASVRGVARVCNNLTISPESTTDTYLIKAVRNALSKANFTTNQIHVDISEGIVRLTGLVTSDYAREQAGLIASSVPGVTAVQNNLVVRFVDTGGGSI